MPRKTPLRLRQRSECRSSSPDDSSGTKRNSPDRPHLPPPPESASMSDDSAKAKANVRENSSRAISEEIALRWSDIAENGLSEKECADIIARYPIPENCEFLHPPKLNPELKKLLEETLLMFDARLVAKQRKIATCVVAISKVLDTITTRKLSEINRDELLAILNDVGCLMSDVTHDNSCLRRDLILAEMKASPFVKEILASTEITEYLFGDNAGETMQSAKALEGMLRGLSQSQTANPLKRKKMS